MKKLIFVIIPFMVLICTHAQEVQLPTLSKTQMLEDIDFLYRAIKEVYPHLSIREKVTGTPLHAELDSLHESAAGISTFEEYYYLASKMLTLCQDIHNAFQSFYPEKENRYMSAQSVQLSEQCEFVFDRYSPAGSMSTCTRYIDGEYFVTENWCADNQEIIIPFPAKLLAINGMPIDEYVRTWNRKIDPSIRWDFKNGKYYTERLFHPEITGLSEEIEYAITYQLNDSVQTVRLKNFGIRGIEYSDGGAFKVLYFPDESVLYIRLPAMDSEQIKFYQREIRKYAGKNIQKTVIDIRDNGGGNDLVWMNILQAIIDKPVTVKNSLYLRNTPLAKDYMQNIRKENIDTPNPQLFYVGNEEFFELPDVEDVIKPSKKSICYGGKIYVLVNSYCFSSSLAFSSFCNRTDRLVTVGQPSGFIGGRATTPFFFALPHSKLIFEISSTLDATNVHTEADYYDNYVEKQIPLTIHDIHSENKYQGERYGKEFLFNHDTVFKAVLKMEE